MQYFLYLRRSLTRAWRTHILLLLLLSCAISLPLCLSILESSYVRGAMEDNVRRGVNHDVKFENAVLGDEAYFQAIEDADVFWENGNLYIDAHQNLTKKESTRFADKARGIAGEHPERGWMVNVLAGLQAEEAWYRFPVKYHLAVGIFAAFLVCLTFAGFWSRQLSEMGKLQAIGAQNHQIMLLYFLHYVMVSVAGTMVSFLTTAVFLKIMTIRFLGYTLTDADASVFANAPLFRFSIEWSRLFRCLGRIWAVSTAFFIVAFPLHIFRKNIHTLLAASKRKPVFRLRYKRTLSALIGCILLRKGCVKPLLCVIFSVPLLLCSILLLQRQTDTSSLLAEVPEYGYAVYIDARRRTMNTDELREIADLDGIADVRNITDAAFTTDYYLIQDENGTESRRFNDDIVTGYEPYLCPWNGDLPTQENADGEKVYAAAIGGDVQNRYEKGEILALSRAGVGSKYVKIVEIMDKGETDRILAENGLYARALADTGAYNLYASKKTGAEQENDQSQSDYLGSYDMFLFLREEDIAELEAFQRVDSFQIKITEPEQAETVKRAIFDWFNTGDIIFFENNYTDSLVAYNRAVGMNLLYTTLSALLFLFFATITTLSLIDYAASHRETLRLLHMQGASHRAIIAAFVEILLPPAILTCAAVWAIVTPVERAYYRLRGYTDALMAKMDLRMIDDPRYLLAALAVAAVFVVPAVVTVARELRRLERG